MKDFLKKFGVLIFFEILLVIVFWKFYGRFGSLFTDSFREAYIPYQMLKGNVLYKDILCIYPPLSYLVNEFLYFLFGANLKVLYVAGLFTTMGIFYFTHKLSDMFLKKYLTFGILLFLLSGFVLSFNAFFPYSYGMTYGMLAILATVYFALQKKYTPAYLLYSVAVCFKLEFILFLLVLIFLSKTQNWVKNLVALILPPTIVLSILLIQGVSFSDLKLSAEILDLMRQSEVLKYFYVCKGIIFVPKLIPVYIKAFINSLIPWNFTFYHSILIWAFPLTTIFTIIRLKKFSFNEKIFIISAMLISAKVYFAVLLQSYGAMFLPFVLIALGIALPEKIRKVFAVYVIFWSIIISSSYIDFYKARAYELKTNMGVIKANFNESKTFNKLIDYFEKTPQNTKLVVFPECLLVNFMTKRESDNKFYSLHPMNVEVFGEENIIYRLSKTKPEYIVISNFDTSEYYFKEFGNDYGKNILNWVKSNYKQSDTIGNDLKFVIYKN